MINLSKISRDKSDVVRYDGILLESFEFDCALIKEICLERCGRFSISLFVDEDEKECIERYAFFYVSCKDMYNYLGSSVDLLSIIPETVYLYDKDYDGNIIKEVETSKSFLEASHSDYLPLEGYYYQG